MTTESRTGRVLRRLVEVSFRRPWTVIGILVALFIVLVRIAGTLELRGDFIELLPRDSEEVRDLRWVEERAGGEGYLVVQVTGGSREGRRAFAGALAPRLEAQKDLVRYADHRFDVGFFRDRALLLMPTERLRSLRDDLRARIDYERESESPFDLGLDDEDRKRDAPPGFDAIEKTYSPEAPLAEYLESKNGEELYIYVKPTAQAGDLEFDRRLIARVTALTDEARGASPGVTVAFTGTYVMLVEENAVMSADLVRAGVVATVIALAILLLSTRRPSALVIVAAPVALGIAATFAFAKGIVGHLNPVTGFLGAILIGLGVEYGVHLSMRYWEEREELGALDAMRRAVAGTFPGALTSAATNAAAFVVLVFAELEAFRQFGKIAAFGVMSTLAATYAMAPAVLFLSEKIRPGAAPLASATARREGESGASESGAAEPGVGQSRSARPIPSGVLYGLMAAILGFAVYSVVVSPRVGFATDLEELKGESPATVLDKHVSEQLGVVWRPAVVHVRSIEDARLAAEIAGQVKGDAAGRASIAEVVSIDDLLPHDTAARLALMAEIRDDLAGLRRAKDPRVEAVSKLLAATPWSPEELPPEVRRRFTPLSGGGTFVLIFPRSSGYDARELELWAADVDEVMKRLRARGIEAHVLDGNRIAARIFALIKGDGPRVLGLAALVVFSMIWLSLRSLRRALLVAGPLYAGLVCLFGAMHLAGVQLNFLNVVVLPNLLAIAVDNSVHLFHRYEEEGPGSLGRVLARTGFAAVVATTSNAAGYGAMLVARHAGLRSVGELALLGVACTFAGTTLLFPAVLALLERRRKLPVTAAP